MIGCGVIARQYLDTAKRLDAIEVVAAADLRPERAAAVEASDGPRAMSVDALLADAGVDLVLNLTIPAAHADVALAAIAAGEARLRGEATRIDDGRGARRILDGRLEGRPARGLRTRHRPRHRDPDST